MRNASISRKTLETEISVELELDGTGESAINTRMGFMDHMLTLFAKHGRFDLSVQCIGDLHVDYHHSVEDIGIALGSAFASSLGEMRGIKRYGNFFMPMDECLTMVAIDLSGRSYLNFDVKIPAAKVGEFDTETVKEFFYGFCRKLNATIHIKNMYGENTHHIIESCFKGFARALAQAVEIDERLGNEIPSTKGLII